MTQPPPPGLPANPATHPTPDAPHQPAPAASDNASRVEVPAGLSPQAQNNSLDNLESSVGIGFIPRPHQALTTPPTLATAFRHGGWWQLRRRVLEGLVRTHQTESRISAFCACGSNSWLQRSDEASPRYRIQTSSCHDRMCTPCANVRAMHIREALLRHVGGKPVSFITLTLSGRDDDLTALVDRLYKSFRYLRSHPLWDAKVAGGAAFLEVKWNDKAKRWHPHLHIIADAAFIPQAELSAVWHGITKDSFVVDVRRVRDDATVLAYVTKYTTKPLNSTLMADPYILDKTIMALKGRRLCLCFGSWYGTPLSAAEDVELLDEDDYGVTWENLIPMHVLLNDALNGDADATRMLELANGRDRFRAMCLNIPNNTS
jgi:hypothetical protein